MKKEFVGIAITFHVTAPSCPISFTYATKLFSTHTFLKLIYCQEIPENDPCFAQEIPVNDWKQ